MKQTLARVFAPLLIAMTATANPAHAMGPVARDEVQAKVTGVNPLVVPPGKSVTILGGAFQPAGWDLRVSAYEDGWSEVKPVHWTNSQIVFQPNKEFHRRQLYLRYYKGNEVKVVSLASKGFLFLWLPPSQVKVGFEMEGKHWLRAGSQTLWGGYLVPPPADGDMSQPWSITDPALLSQVKVRFGSTDAKVSRIDSGGTVHLSIPGLTEPVHAPVTVQTPGGTFTTPQDVYYAPPPSGFRIQIGRNNYQFGTQYFDWNLPYLPRGFQNSQMDHHPFKQILYRVVGDDLFLTIDGQRAPGSYSMLGSLNGYQASPGITHNWYVAPDAASGKQIGQFSLTNDAPLGMRDLSCVRWGGTVAVNQLLHHTPIGRYELVEWQAVRAAEFRLADGSVASQPLPVFSGDAVDVQLRVTEVWGPGNIPVAQLTSDNPRLVSAPARAVLSPQTLALSQLTSFTATPAPFKIIGTQPQTAIRLQTQPVSRRTSVTVTALLFPGPPTPLQLDLLPAPILESIRLDASQLVSGGTATGTVVVKNMTAANKMVKVRLDCQDPAITLPDTVAVIDGQGTFTVQSQPITADRSVTIGAQLGTAPGQRHTFTLVAAPPSSGIALRLNARSIPAGGTFSGTVTLDRPSRTDVRVALSADTRSITIPAEVSVRAGETSGSFRGSASTLLRSQTVATITATTGASAARASLTITTGR